MRKRTPTPVLRRRFEFDRPRVPLAVWILGLVLIAAFVEVWQVTRVSALTLDTERAARVACPSKIAVQMPALVSWSVAWSTVQMPIGTAICETIEM